MSFLPLIVQLVSGAIGGNAAGKLIKKIDLGVLGNSLAGILGGGLGGQLLNMLGIGVSESGSLDLASVIGSIASGGAGGGVIMAVIGAIKAAMAKSK